MTEGAKMMGLKLSPTIHLRMENLTARLNLDSKREVALRALELGLAELERRQRGGDGAQG